MTKKRNILFDGGVPRPLRKRLLPHRIATTQELGWELLRAFRISMKYFEPLLPQILETLETIEPGHAVYIYADPRLAQKDQRKGRR